MIHLSRNRNVLAAMVVLAATANAQTLTGTALAQALQRGGYVTVMRHASSPQTLPTAQDADPKNVNHERQLDQAGIESTKDIGH